MGRTRSLPVLNQTQLICGICVQGLKKNYGSIQNYSDIVVLGVAIRRGKIFSNYQISHNVVETYTFDVHGDIYRLVYSNKKN
jgi:hypothetical protein